MSQRILWNKETNQAVQIGDKLQSFRDEPWIIQYWNSATKKVVAIEADNSKNKGFQRELYHTVFPALEWREDA